VKVKSGILFLVFNRPDPTRQVFDAIRAAQPPRLYLAGDGPRSNRNGEAERCAEVRRIVELVDWACEVKTLFRPANVGCRRAVTEAISWFFGQETEGIILEDDCLPAASFFQYCDELLDRYRNDDRVWQICGTDMVGRPPTDESRPSYRFSKYGPVWGWASWRRAWQQHDPNLSDWPFMSTPEMLQSAYPTAAERDIRLALGDKLFRGEIDTWDYQWGFTKNFNHGLSIIPSGNLIRNIGFGADATHSTSTNERGPQSLHQPSFPLRHPKYVLPDARHDAEYLSRFLRSQAGPVRRAMSRVFRLMLRR
jgi:hypothetical protein